MQWIADNPGEDLSTANLARRACMSVRSLHRHFVAEAGVTPASFVEARRLEQAQRLLTLTSQRLERVARNSGFGSIDALRAAFMRRHGVTPSEFRRRFASDAKRGAR
jgi:transcriptional regulator GlxA family with amidase domain